MSENPVLIETSFADAIGIIQAATELPEQTRRHWASSLRQIARACDKPLDVIPARYSAVRAHLAQLHEVPAGLTTKTLRNHKSNAKTALLWLARERGIPEHGAPLTPAWQALRDGIGDALVRMRLSSLMRYCSANSIAPVDVDEDAIDRFMAYRSGVGQPADDAARRLMAKAWNANVGQIPGWSEHRLVEPAPKAATEIAWLDFPEGLREGVDGYLTTLTGVRRNRTGQRIRPLRPSTIRVRRAELAAAARMAVKSGVPIETLDSLGALLAPDVAENVLDTYWLRNGETPKLFTIELARRFLAIASETKCVDEQARQRLYHMWRDLEDHRVEGLTDKNIALIRQVLTPSVWSRVVKLPFQMMAEARRLQETAPTRAAVTAQIAVAIAILTAAPVRLANLTEIRLDFNLIKPGGPESDYWLVFPDYDVKNRVRLEYPLADYASRLIEEYVHDFRPTLLRGRNKDWLFPGQRGGAKGKIAFSGQITDRIRKATGLRITVHQFRHAAAAVVLQHRPGEYELVRLLLGHRNVQTTMKAYVGLDSIRASEVFGQIIRDQIGDVSEVAA